MRSVIKKKMVEKGRDDFVTYLAELLGITRATASKRLRGQSQFTEKEIRTICKKLDFTADDLMQMIIKG